jgi:hypothetical protein
VIAAAAPGRPRARRRCWAAAARALLAAALGAALTTAVRPDAAPAQPAEPAIELRPQWKVGDRQALSIVRVRESSRGGQVARTTTRGDATLVVREAGPAGWLVEWTFAAPRVEDADAQRAALARELAALTSGMRYELEIDADGRLVRLRNWQQLQALSQSAVQKVVDRLRARGTPPDVLSAITGTVTAMFSSEEQIRTHGLRDAALYHAAHGYPFRAGVPLEYAMELPSPLGGVGVPSRGRFTLLGVEQGAAVIEWQQRADPAAAREAVRRALTDLAARMGRPAPRDDELPEVAVEDDAQLRIEIATGWVRTLSHRRTSRSGPATRVDELSLRARP